MKFNGKGCPSLIQQYAIKAWEYVDVQLHAHLTSVPLENATRFTSRRQLTFWRRIFFANFSTPVFKM